MRCLFSIPTICLCSMLAAMVGCAKKTTNVDRGRAEQELYIGIGDEPSSLDPQLITGLIELSVLVSLFEGLTTINPATGETTSAIAESWDISSDGCTYTFHIDPKANWTNGEKITSQDFLFSFERILTPAFGAPYAYMLFPMRGAEAYSKGELTDFSKVGASAPDPDTLVIELAQATPYFLSLLTHNTWWPVHPPTILKHGSMTDRISKWTKPGNLVSSGPYTLTKWRLNSSITVEKNPYYRAPETLKLNGVHFMPIDIDTEERAFRANHLHITETVPTHRIDWYRENKPDSIRFDTSLAVYYYMLNTKSGPLADARVRKALAYSINREALTEFVLKAGQKPAYNFTPPNAGGYNSRTKLPYDPDLARQLLAEAGFPDGKGFPTFELLYNTSESHRVLAVAIQQMWKKELGIDISLYNQEWKAYLSTREAKKFDILRASWFGDYDDPNTFLSLGETENGNNHTSWSNAEYDTLIKQAAVTLDPAARHEIFQQAEAILLDEMPFLPIYFYVNARLINPSVKGWYPNILDYHLYQAVSLSDD